MLKNFVNKYPLLVFILVLTFIIRLIAGHEQSFSNDELSALYRLQYHNFYDLMLWGVQVDNHPAFTQIFLYAWESIVPKGEVWIRLPFIVATTASLGYIFFSIKKLSGEFAAYMVTIILAFAGFSIQLGYFARPYAFGILFTSAATYYWIRIFIDRDRSKRYLMFFILCAILSAYTHYLALLQIAILGMATFFFAPAKLWWKIVVAGVVSVVGFLPHYTITKYHLSVGGIGAWLAKAHDYFIIDVLFEYFDRNPIIIGAALLICLIVIVIGPPKPVLKNILFLVFISFTPFLILYFYTVKVNPLLQYSACFFLMPSLLGAFFSLFRASKDSFPVIKYLYIGFIVIFLSSTLYSYSAFAPVHFAEFKKIAEYIEEHESDSVTTVVAVNNPFYIDYYLKDKHPDMYITDMGDNLNFLRIYIDTCKTQDFIYAFTNERSNGEIPYMVNNRFKEVRTIHKYLNSEMYHFANPDLFSWDHEKAYEPLYCYSYQSFTKNFVETTEWPEPFVVDSSQEFLATFEIDLAVLNLKPYNEVVVSALPQLNTDCDFEVVISIEENGKNVFWRARKFKSISKIVPHAKDSTTTSLTSNGYFFPMNATSMTIPLTTYIGLAENLNDDNINLKKAKLKSYIWNPNHKTSALAGFSVKFYEGNPYTTGYSQ